MMKVLCLDNPELKHLFVLEVCAAYYDEDVAGLVLTPVYSSFDDFCFPDLSLSLCNDIIRSLYIENQVDMTWAGEIQLYSDIVNVDDEE